MSCPPPCPYDSYTPNLSKRVTHVLVDANGTLQTEKMQSLRADRATWAHVEVVALEWLAKCTSDGARAPEERFRVIPSHMKVCGVAGAPVI